MGWTRNLVGSSSCPAGHGQPPQLPRGVGNAPSRAGSRHSPAGAARAPVMPWNGCREISEKVFCSQHCFETPWQGIPLSYANTSKSGMGAQSLGDRSDGCGAPSCSFLCFVLFLRFRISSSSSTHFLCFETSPRYPTPFCSTPNSLQPLMSCPQGLTPTWKQGPRTTGGHSPARGPLQPHGACWRAGPGQLVPPITNSFPMGLCLHVAAEPPAAPVLALSEE